MGDLTRDQLLGAADLPREDVDIPELGGAVTVRGLSGLERDRFEASLLETKHGKRRVNTVNARARLVAMTAVNGTGQLMFTQADLDRLGAVRADVLDRLYGVAARLSGLRSEDLDELGITSDETPDDD